MSLHRIIRFDTIDSTNQYCKKEASNLRSGDIVLSKVQTAGKGRLGRNFNSCDGGIYMSYFVRINEITEKASLFTGMAAVATINAIYKICGVRPSIKWTNDLLLNGKKICGILCESGKDALNESYVIIGIGINTNRTEFPNDIKDIASSIYIETKEAVIDDLLVEAIAAGIDEMIEHWKCSDIFSYIEQYRTNCITIGKDVSFEKDGQKYIGIAQNIDDRFGLEIILENRNKYVLRSGEASIKANNKST